MGEAVWGMRAARLLLLFPPVGKIPDTWPTLSRQNTRTRYLAPSYIEVADMRSLAGRKFRRRVMTLQKFFRCDKQAKENAVKAAANK